MRPRHTLGSAEEARYEGGMNAFGPIGRWRLRRDSTARARRSACCRSLGGRQHVASSTKVFDKRQLQHARPGPELAHRQRRDRLKGGDESRKTLRVEVARAGSNQLQRQGMNAGHAFELIGDDGGSRLKNEVGKSRAISARPR